MGVVPTEQALAKAREVSQDLVEVAPQAKPPVCRIMDYGKYKYQQSKKQAKSHSHHTKTKEIRLRPKTGKHDMQLRMTQNTSPDETLQIFKRYNRDDLEWVERFQWKKAFGQKMKDMLG